MDMQKIYDFIDSQYPSMLHLWKEIVLIESGSANLEGVNTLAAHMDTYLVAMGLETKKYAYPTAGAGVAAWTPEGSLPPVLLMAHMDTVHAKGSFGDKLWVEEEGIIHGAGVYDCKGGIAVALLVTKALQFAGYKKRQIKLLFTGDEEVAHQLSNEASLALYHENAPGAAAAFNCESAPAKGDVVLQRKGANIFKIKVHGISAHTGRAPLKGANAIREAAKLVEKLESLTDYPDGVYCNCGKISGGSAVNSVPDYCEISASLRYSSLGMYEEAMAKIREICAHPSDSRITVELVEQAKFPAMEKVAKSDALYEVYRNACVELGFAAPAALYEGGASDAAHTTLAGVPTICGCGVRGGDNHSPLEWAVPESLKESAKKIVTAILRLPDDF